MITTTMAVKGGSLMVNRHEVIAQLYRTNVPAFVDFAFRQLHPGKELKRHWYHDVIADRVDAVLKGKIRRLVINAPPRTLKTVIATLALIALYLGRNPTRQVLLITGHPALANELMKRLGQLIGSDRYRGIFPHMQLTITGTTIQTRHGGSLRVATVGQQLSGHGADLMIVDDPLSPSHAADGNVRKKANEWFDTEVLQRLNDRSGGALVLVMQRVHEGDLSGHLQVGIHGFKFVVLPAIATSDEKWLLSDGRQLFRRQGEVLHPETDCLEQQRGLWRQVGDFVYATQYLQNTCGSRNGPMEIRWKPKGPEWSPENWSLGSGFCQVTYQQIIMHKAFGHPLPEYANWLRELPLTLEEWEAVAVAHMRRLTELHEDPPVSCG